MKILSKPTSELAAERMTLGGMVDDLFDLAAVAASLVAMLKQRDADVIETDLAAENIHRLARMVAEGVTRAGEALCHVQAPVMEAPFPALRVAVVLPPGEGQS